MQLRREKKDSGKINYCNVNQGNENNVTIITFNSDTDFQKYLKLNSWHSYPRKSKDKKDQANFFLT